MPSLMMLVLPSFLHGRSLCWRRGLLLFLSVSSRSIERPAPLSCVLVCACVCVCVCAVASNNTIPHVRVPLLHNSRSTT
jgi:hypothetical protein